MDAIGGFWELADAVRATGRRADERVPATYLYTDDDGTAWVELVGSQEPMPVTGMVTAELSPGDEVLAIVGGGQLTIVGNASAPSVGQTRVDASVAPVDRKADEALAEASRASAAADAAEADAQRAHEAADAAQASADAAQESADAANASAAAAQASAGTANRAANDALAGLSTVQDVVGVVEWAAAHSEQDMASYISSHLALTDAGLWVTLDASGYRLLLAADGVRVVDPAGHTVSTFGESVSFDSSRPQWIGGEDAYVAWVDEDGDGAPDTLVMGGSVVVGSKTLTELLGDVARAASDAQEARRAAEDVPIVTLSSTNGTVFKRNLGVSTTIVATVFTPGGRISDAAELRRRFGAGAYLQWGWRDVVTDADHALVSDDPRIILDGFGLVVSPDDIDTQAVITCSLNY